MGPRRTPHKQREPGNYEAIGKVGRRTGATLKDTGVRDEHGFEPIPSFSSPTKSLFPGNGTAHEGTNSAEDSMDIDESTVPESTELLQSVRSGRVSLPPKATAPIKTHTNSSPRRSMPRSIGPLSSPSRNSNNNTPTRATSHPPINKSRDKVLNISSEGIRESIERSPPKAPALRSVQPTATSSQMRNQGKRKKAFDLTEGSNEEDASATGDLDGGGLTNGIMNDDDSIIPNGDDQTMLDSTIDPGVPDGDQAEEQLQPPEPESPKLMGPPAISGAKPLKKKPGRAPKSQVVNHNESQSTAEDTEQRSGRGRPPKKTQVYQDQDDGVPATSTSGPKTKRPPPPSERDANARPKSKKQTSEKAPSRSGSVAPGPRFVPRSQTPANDMGALMTRYGRPSIKPLATWRGEKAVMGDRTLDSLPGIKEVIRVDEIVESRPKQRHRKGRYRPRTPLTGVEEEDPEEDREPWELDPGIMVAQVMDWDAENNRYDEESTREEDIAYSHEAIQMRDIQGADFKFAKTLTLDFFGSGMVQLPPGGAKRIKNSRKMQMVFFVFYGRVTVNIGTPPTRFSIGKGGQWQVPRGNFYSITNESTTNDARIFFAQGCEIQAGIADESAMA